MLSRAFLYKCNCTSQAFIYVYKAFSPFNFIKYVEFLRIQIILINYFEKQKQKNKKHPQSGNWQYISYGLIQSEMRAEYEPWEL